MSHGSSIFALGILILIGLNYYPHLMGLNYYPHQAWCMDCQVLKRKNMYVRNVLLASNKEVLFQVGEIMEST